MACVTYGGRVAEDIIKSAQERLKRDQEAWSENYRKARDDLHFLSDDPYAQWDESDYQSRTSTGRPALTIDQLGQFVHQVANDIRQNTPSINVIPGGKDSDIETAEIFQGLIRNIEYASNADDAYDTAALNAVKCGIGFLRVDHDYSDDESFNQDLFIRRVVNPLGCWIDSNSVECDGKDARHATIIDKISIDEFKRKYPGKDPICFESPDERDDRKSGKDVITIAEHFVLEEEEIEIGMDDAGNVFEYQKGMPISNTRKIRKSKVKHFKLSGQDVLEETWFPGKYIPIVPVYGEEHWKDGRRSLFSLIRKSKAAQRMFNYWVSLETELLMKTPKAPVMAAEGQIEDFADDWQNPDKAMVLRYKQQDAQGNPAPAPQRLDPPTVPTGIVNAARETVDYIKATMGMYNAAIGQRSNETSGVAINQRKQEGDVATYHFGDNLVRSITHLGRILVCAIPEIYDTPRVIRIIGLEDESKEIGVNGEAVEGQEREFDLRQGKYDVKVVTGASYTTKRQEAAQFFSDVVTRQPELMQVMGDLLFKNMDFAGAQAMSERMKKVIDPKFLEEDKAQDPEKMQLEAKIQEGQMLLQAMQQEMAQLQQQLQDKQADLQLKAQEGMADAEEASAKIEIQKIELQLKQQEMAAENQIRMMEIQLKARELDLKEQEIKAGILQAQQAMHNELATANNAGMSPRSQGEETNDD